MVKISVIIPVYKCEKYIENALALFAKHYRILKLFIKPSGRFIKNIAVFTILAIQDKIKMPCIIRFYTFMAGEK